MRGLHKKGNGRQWSLPAVWGDQLERGKLSVSVSATTTMKATASTANTCTTAEAAAPAANCCAAAEATTNWAARESAACYDSGASSKSRTTPEPWATIKARASIEAVEPWAGTDKDSAGKPLRPVVAVRRTGVRVITVIAVSADRGYADVAGATDPDSNHDSLCACV